MLSRKRAKSKAIISDSDDEDIITVPGKKKNNVKQLFVLTLFSLLFLSYTFIALTMKRKKPFLARRKSLRTTTTMMEMVMFLQRQT
jgi:hypothetical protein